MFFTQGYVEPKLGQVSKAREDRDYPMDVGGFGHWHWQRKGNRKTWCEIIGTSKRAEDSRSVLELRENRVVNRRTAGQGHSSRVKDSPISSGKGNDVKGKSGKGGGKTGKSKGAGALVCGINNRARLRARWHRLHHRRKQAQQVGTG